MRNRNLLIHKIENLEGFLKTLRITAKNGSDIETYNKFLTYSEDTLEDIKSMIEREEMTGNEINVNRN